MNEPGLEQSVDGELLLQAQTEVRHLKKTIGALRDEMEDLDFKNQENVQEAVAGAADEAIQLKDTAGALRDELENLSFDKDKAVQEAIAHGNDDIQQLKKTAGGNVLEKAKSYPHFEKRNSFEMN
jgi:hypothetical protein